MKSQENTNWPNIRPLQESDIELLGDRYAPWSSKQETIERWKQYLQEHRQGARIACIVDYQNVIAGYGSLLLPSQYPPFKNKNIPEIADVWIYDQHRGKGLGTLLITHFEKLAKERGHDQIGIGVGLYRDYGPAQKLYFRLGYQPDGEGVSYKHISVVPGESYPIDDDLILWLIKNLMTLPIEGDTGDLHANV